MKYSLIVFLAPLLTIMGVGDRGGAAETVGAVPRTVFDIREFGAVGDGATLNTRAIQQAIDGCTAAGGGDVLIAGGSFVTGTIYLKDHVTLHLAAGAALLGSTQIADYATDTAAETVRLNAVQDATVLP